MTSLLTNISYSLDKQQMIMKDLADKTLSFRSQNLSIGESKSKFMPQAVLNRPIQSQNKQKEKTSSSGSSSEEDERYQVFKDTFISLMKKKLPESALMLDIRTLKQVYTLEMEKIEDCLKKIVNYRDEIYKAYWAKCTMHK
ncbi:unnamed protein product, partial [Brachionus calyciflorus]